MISQAVLPCDDSHDREAHTVPAETPEQSEVLVTRRVFVLRGAGGKAFVAGTDIGQFKSFKTAEDGIQYERDGERRTSRQETMAQRSSPERRTKVPRPSARGTPEYATLPPL